MQAMAILNPSETPLTILAEGYLSTRHAKTGTGVIRYGNWPISSVIDSTNIGKDLKNIAGLNSTAPILASLEEALQMEPKPKALLIGIAPIGGELPAAWLDLIRLAIKNGLHVINGLHDYLSSREDLVELAQENKVILWDVRNPDLYESSKNHYVAKHKPRTTSVKVITMVGTDCNVGKMCTALELQEALKERGIKASFLATGQTGIIISGDGVPLDRNICDFSAGAMEAEIERIIAAEEPDLILVEGQGSLLHPGYSGVTLSLLHGSNPDYMILCTKAGNEKILGGYEVKIPSLEKVIKLYEEAASWVGIEGKESAKVIGISANTSSLDENATKSYINLTESLTGLPCADLFKSGKEKLVETIVKIYEN